MSKHNRSNRSRTHNPDHAEAQGHRQERLEKILFEELTSLFRDEARNPVFESLEIINVEMSPDGSSARVGYVAHAPLSEEALIAQESKEALARAGGFFRARLASQLNLKRMPKLVFRFVGMREPLPGKGGEPWAD